MGGKQDENVWYVIQTKTGNEEDVRDLVLKMTDKTLCRRCFLPLFEEVRRREGKSRIVFRRLFPGYLFLDTKNPAEIHMTLKRIPEFTRLLSCEEEDGEKLFLPVEEEDEAFLDSLFDEGVMHVSYVHQVKNGRIGQVVGPLARYSTHITKLEYRHRLAIVEADIFGKHRRIKFGLWTEEDEPLPWLEEQLAQGKKETKPFLPDIDLGLAPGDRIMDETGVYGDQVFVVDSVDKKHRTVQTIARLGLATVRIELFADKVRKV